MGGNQLDYNRYFENIFGKVKFRFENVYFPILTKIFESNWSLIYISYKHIHSLHYSKFWFSWLWSWKPKLWNLQWVCMKITNFRYGRTFSSIHQMKAKKRTKITESCRAVPLSWRTGFASISQSGEPTWKIYKFDQVDFELGKFHLVIKPEVELITW